MSIELAIIKSFIKDIDIYNKYYTYIKDLALEKEIKVLFKVIDSYFTKYQEHTYISKDEFKVHYKYLYPSAKEQSLICQMIDEVFDLDTSDSLASDLVKALVKKDFANKLVNKCLPILSGEDVDILDDLKVLLEEYEQAVNVEVEEESPFLQYSLSELLDKEVHGDGINWRLKCLQEDIGPLRGGSLGHVFARPDTGKTTFMISELSHFASQLGEDECIIWVNNEEKGSKVNLRLFSGICGAPKATLVQHVEKAEEIFKSKGGHKIKLVDEAILSINNLEQLIKKYNPRIMVIDQGDKIVFSGAKDMSNVDRLKALYVKFRELAKKYSIDIITAGQASAEAANKKWLSQDYMDNSKTGKPGELDYAIGIGVVDSDDNRRYIHLCKNKMNNGVHGKHITLIDTEKVRYVDV